MQLDVMLRNLLLIFIVVLTHFAGACQDMDKSQSAVFLISDIVNTISIKNNSSQQARFTFDINGAFPLTDQMIQSTIEKNANAKGIHVTESAWEFVIEHTYHSGTTVPGQWIHDPVYFMNSRGGGLCDDLASVLAGIWKDMGFQSRIIDLTGHVVPEVFYNGKWHMYDPDRKIFYCKDGDVLGVAELADNLEAIKNPASFCSSSFNPAFKFSNAVTENLARKFKSVDDNLDLTDWHFNYKAIDQHFVLPPYAELLVRFDKYLHQIDLEVILSGSSKGLLKIPFTPVKAEGHFNFLADSSLINVSNENFFFSSDSYVESSYIVNVESHGKINYLVNEKLKFIGDQNTINIQSSEKLDLRFFASESETDFSNPFLFFDTLQAKHASYLSVARPIEQNQNVSDYLTTEYKQFLKLDPSVTETEKAALIREFEQYKKELTSVSSSAGITKAIQKTFPVSLSYLFLVARYGRMDLLKSFAERKFENQ